MDKQKNEVTDNSTTIDEDVMQAFMKHRLFKKDGTKRNDITEMLKSICMIFDLNFKRSFEILEEKSIFKKKS